MSFTEGAVLQATRPCNRMKSRSVAPYLVYEADNFEFALAKLVADGLPHMTRMRATVCNLERPDPRICLFRGDDSADM